MASSLVVLKFDSPEGADKGLELAVSLQKQQLLQLLDAAIVTWPQGKKKPCCARCCGALLAGGSKFILAGISAIIADTFVGIGARFSRIKTTAELQSALEEAKTS